MITSAFEDGDEEEAEFNSANLCYRVIAQASFRNNNSSSSSSSSRSHQRPSSSSVIVGERTGIIIAAAGGELHASKASELLTREKIDGSSKTKKSFEIPSVSLVGTNDSNNSSEDIKVVQMCLSRDESLLACVCHVMTDEQTRLIIVDVASLVHNCDVVYHKDGASNTYIRGVTAPLDELMMKQKQNSTEGIQLHYIRDMCFGSRATLRENEYTLHTITSHGTFLDIDFVINTEIADSKQMYSIDWKAFRDQTCKSLLQTCHHEHNDSVDAMRVTSVSVPSSPSSSPSSVSSHFIAIGVSNPNGVIIASTNTSEEMENCSRGLMYIKIDGNCDNGDACEINSVRWDREDSIVIAMKAELEAEDSPLLIVTTSGESSWDSNEATLKFTKTVAACSGLDGTALIDESDDNEGGIYNVPLLMTAEMRHWGLVVASNRLSTENHLNLIHFSTNKECDSCDIEELDIEDDRYAARIPECEDGSPCFVTGIGIVSAGLDMIQIVGVNGRQLANGVVLMVVARADGTFFFSTIESLDNDIFPQSIAKSVVKDLPNLREFVQDTDVVDTSATTIGNDDDYANELVKRSREIGLPDDEDDGLDELDDTDAENKEALLSDSIKEQDSIGTEPSINVKSVSPSVKEIMSESFTKAILSPDAEGEEKMNAKIDDVTQKSSSSSSSSSLFSSDLHKEHGKNIMTNSTNGNPLDDVKALQSKSTSCSDENTVHLSIHEFSLKGQATSMPLAEKTSSKPTKPKSGVYPTMMATMSQKEMQERLTSSKSKQTSSSSSLNITSSSQKSSQLKSGVYPTMMATMSQKEIQERMSSSKTKLIQSSSTPTSTSSSQKPVKPKAGVYPTMMATMSQREMQERMSLSKTKATPQAPPAPSSPFTSTSTPSSQKPATSKSGVYPTMMATMSPKEIQERMSLSKTKTAPSSSPPPPPPPSSSPFTSTSMSTSSSQKPSQSKAGVYPTMMATMSQKEIQERMASSNTKQTPSSPSSLSSSLPATSISVTSSQKPGKSKSGVYPTVMSTMSPKEIQERTSSSVTTPSQNTLLQNPVNGNKMPSSFGSSDNDVTPPGDNTRRLDMCDRLNQVYDYNVNDVTIHFKELMNELSELEESVDNTMSDLAFDKHASSNNVLSQQDKMIVEFTSKISGLRDATLFSYNGIDEMKSLCGENTRRYLKIQDESELYNDDDHSDDLLKDKLPQDCLDALLLEKDTLLERMSVVEDYIRDFTRSSSNRHELTPKVLIDSVNNIQSHALRQLHAIRDLKESLPVEREDDDIRASLDFKKSSSRKEKSISMKAKKQTKEERKAALFSLLKEARSDVPVSTRSVQGTIEQSSTNVKQKSKNLWSGSKEQWSSIVKDIDEVYGADGGKLSLSFQSNQKEDFVKREDGKAGIGEGVQKKLSASGVSLGQRNNMTNSNMQRIDTGDANRIRGDDEQKRKKDSSTNHQSSSSSFSPISSSNIVLNHQQFGKQQSTTISAAPAISSLHTFSSSSGIASKEALSDVKTNSMQTSQAFGRTDHSEGNNVHEKASSQISASGNAASLFSQPVPSLTNFSIPAPRSTEVKGPSKGFDLKQTEADRSASENGLANTGSKLIPTSLSSSSSSVSSGVKENTKSTEATKPFQIGSQPHSTLAGSDSPAKSDNSNMFSALSFGASTGQSVKADMPVNPFQGSSVSSFTQSQSSTPAFGFSSQGSTAIPPSSTMSLTPSSAPQKQQSLQPSVFGSSNQNNAVTGPKQFGQASSMMTAITQPQAPQTAATAIGAVGFGQSSSPGVSSGFGQPSSFGTASPFGGTNKNLNTATLGSPQGSFSTTSFGSGFGQSSQIGMQTGLFAKSSPPSSAFGSSNFGVMSNQQSSFQGATQNGFGNAFQNAAKSSGASTGFGGNAFSALAAGSVNANAFGGGNSNSFNISVPSPQPQGGAQWEMRK